MKHLLIIALALTLSGCGGGVAGVIRGDGKPVKADYSQGFASDTWEIVVDGEIFKGRAVATNATTTFGNSFGTATATSGTQTATAVGSSTVIGTTMSGNFKAVLLGSKGSSMTCFFNYADSSGFTSMGGVGECQMSSGKMIDITW